MRSCGLDVMSWQYESYILMSSQAWHYETMLKT